MLPRVKIFGFLILILLSAGIIWLACNIDHGIAPLPGKIDVTVIFRNTPPPSTQGIYLIVAPIFPPHAINEMYHSPNSLPIDQDTVHTEMVLPYGHYQSVSLWWYSNDTKSNLADVLALPLDVDNNLLPLSFDITPEAPVFHVDLYANWDRMNRDAAIEGTIYFNGSSPENTLATAVVAYMYQPVESVHYLIWLKSIDFSVEGNPYHYRLPVRHGSVNYIAVFWLPENAGLTDFKTVGVYENPSHPGEPGKLSIKANQIVTGIDIHADWSKITQP